MDLKQLLDADHNVQPGPLQHGSLGSTEETTQVKQVSSKVQLVLYNLPVLLLGVVFALVGAVGNPELVEGGLVAGNFGVQGLLDQRPPLNASLALIKNMNNIKIGREKRI